MSSKRLRKEFLKKKELEQQKQTTAKNKQRFKEAVFSNRKLPSDLKHSANDLFNELLYNNEALNTMDDEYANLKEAKLLVTTSRDPSMRLRQFAKELRYVFPNSEKINRGNLVLSELIALSENKYTDVVLLHEAKGEPSSMTISHLPNGPTAVFSLHNVVLRSELKSKPCIMYPHLIFENFNTQLAERLKKILGSLFPQPKKEATRVVSFINRDDLILFRNHAYERNNSGGLALIDVGPNFEMRLFEITNGCVGEQTAEREWVQRPYMNTSRKRTFL